MMCERDKKLDEAIALELYFAKWYGEDHHLAVALKKNREILQALAKDGDKDE